MWSDWKVYERGGAIFAALEPHMEGFFGAPKKGKELYYVRRGLVGLEGEHLYWCYGKPEYKNDAIKWLARWIKQGVRGSFTRVAKARYAACMKFLLPLLDKPLPRDKKALVKYIDAVNKYLLLHTRTTALSVDAFDDYFDEMASQVFRNAGYGRICDDKERWSQLFRPAYRSVVMNYQGAVIDCALRAKQAGIKECMGNIHEIWKKYFWLTMGWSGTAPIDESGIIKQVRKYMKKSDKALRKQQRVLLAYDKNIAREREKTRSQFHISRVFILPYWRLIDAFACLHDERKEIQMRTLCAMDQARWVLARQYKIPIRNIQLLKIAELRALIKSGEFPHDYARDRKVGYARYFENGRTTREKAGKAALFILREELAIPTGARGKIRGVIASRGFARGRAVVTDSPREAAKLVKKGDILIASMTTPDFVPAMKKAGAIVTNEGGLTCHAAIVARELKKPCIIGTLYATRLLSTGDFVEVDAEKGIVRKIH